MPNWQIEGTADIVGLDGLPQQTRDLCETDRFAVFRDGDRIRLEPVEEVTLDD